MNKKNIIFGASAALLALSLTACGGSSAPQDQTADASKPSESSTQSKNENTQKQVLLSDYLGAERDSAELEQLCADIFGNPQDIADAVGNSGDDYEGATYRVNIEERSGDQEVRFNCSIDGPGEYREIPTLSMTARTQANDFATEGSGRYEEDTRSKSTTYGFNGKSLVELEVLAKGSNGVDKNVADEAGAQSYADEAAKRFAY